MNIYNSLTRRVEEFKPISPPDVGLYTCGPTVYHYAHVGNLRTWLLSDLVMRALKFQGYSVKFIMNLTDVGHLTGDNLGDADMGEDRMEKAARSEGRTVWDIARFYTDAFMVDFQAMNFLSPEVFSKATDHITEQIELVRKLEERGYTYRISDGVYFDTAKFLEYGKLSTLSEIKEGARVEPNTEKKNPRDFALWKFSQPEEKRQMEWDSPWGKGFPGWHIECSAMAGKYLGETFDIHIGGEDLRSTHHPNEIAQSEAASGKKFVNFWMHGAFILINGKRMSKSEGNYYKLQDLVEKGYDPMDLRYLYLTSHYRDQLNLTLEALDGARNARRRLKDLVSGWMENANSRDTISQEKVKMADKFVFEFGNSIDDDLNTARAIATVWEMAKSMIPDRDKLDLIREWDSVLGLKLLETSSVDIPDEIAKLLSQRRNAREEKDWQKADSIRDQIEALGWAIEDRQGIAKVKRK
jgi:cysteinyl-tRNA synthetase